MTLSLCADWFIAVEVLMTLALICQLLSLVFAIVYLLRGCVMREQHYALLAASLIGFGAGRILFPRVVLEAPSSGLVLVLTPKGVN